MARPNASLTVVKDDRRTIVNVGRTFSIGSSHLNCARIEPAFRKGREVIEYIYFTSFTHLPNRIDFGDRKFVKLVPSTAYTITIISPQMIPAPNGLNMKIRNAEDFCRVQLFRRADGQEAVFVRNFVGTWDLMADTIISHLRREGLNFENIRVALIQDMNRVPEPHEFVLLENFFSRMANGKEIMILCCDLDDSLVLECQGYTVSTHVLPTVPRVLATLAIEKMLSIENDHTQLTPQDRQALQVQQAKLRRILTVSANSGVMVDLVEGAGLQIDGHIIQSTNFDTIELNWDISSKLAFDSAAFHLPRKCFENLLQISNEATLGGSFWTSALNAALLPSLTSGRLRSMQEWNTNDLLPDFPKRRVDYVACIHCLYEGTTVQVSDYCPLLFGEYSRETVSIGNYHKDFLKSCCMASAFCLCMAYKLIATGRDPKLARCFGLLIGGTSARLIMAFPVVRNVGGNEYEIQIHIECSEVWRVDIVSGERADRLIVDGIPSETFTRSNRNFPAWGDFSFVNRGRRDPGREASIHVATEDEEASETPSAPLDLGSDDLFKGGVSDAGLSQIHYIGKLVLHHADLICANVVETPGVAVRTYKPASKYGFIPSAKPSSVVQTPVTTRAAARIPTASTNVPFAGTLDGQRTPTRMQVITKPTNRIELLVYREASIFLPGFLPRIYDIIEMPETGEVKYIMESLEPLASNSGVMHPFFAKNRSADILYTNCKFMLDCLFQLYLIHEHLQLVHSDVSPSNIMYSKADRIWKLIDFNQAMPRSESESTKRVAGTPDFIAPEAVESGIFTAASDIWSLGQLAFNWLLPNLTMGVYGGDDSDSDSEEEDNQRRRDFPKWLQRCCDIVVGCIAKMVSGYPSDRPTVIEAIKLFYSVVNRFETDNDPNDLILEGVRNLLRSVELKARETSEASTSTAPVASAPVASTSAKRRFEDPAHEKDPLEPERPGIH